VHQAQEHLSPASTDQLANECVALLARCGLTLALAESCTGGLVAHHITNVSGSSAAFLGGVVSYSNEAKNQILGVAQEVLETVGAVSTETALEMAQGARHLFGADVALSVTGIAGPTGGTEEKPVGLVYIHLSAADVDFGERWNWSGSREQNKSQSAEAVLRLLLSYLTTKFDSTL